MEDKKPIQANVNLNIESTPVLYADNVYWNVSPDGVILNFGQSIMGSGGVRIVSRVGMSREFVKRFIADLGKNLALTEGHGQTGKAKS